MSEEKKGRVRITMEIEINEALMEMAKESMAKMPELWSKMFRRREEAQPP